MIKLTQEYLKEIIDYNPETGIMTNKKTRSSNAVAGKIINCSTSTKKYGRVTINKKTYRLHRLIWFYMYGKWPKNEIDHINGNTSDNKLCNLRECSRQENIFNRKSTKGSSSKYKGVSLKNNKWIVQIQINKINKYIGSFSNKVEAALAYDTAAKKYHKEFAYLNFNSPVAD